MGAVVFDLFGTLIANYDRLHYYEVIERMGEAAGADPIEFRKRWYECYVERLTGVFATESENIQWVCDQLGVAPEPASIERSNQVYREFALPFLMTPRTSSVEMLTALKSRGIKTGLLSDCGPWVPANWADSPFADLIDFPVYSSMSGMKKPNATLYQNAARGLGVNPSECMYVADGNGEELVVARQLGMRAVKIEPWNEPGSAPDADYSNQWDGESVDALSELIEMID
ncbi:HAD hydrolase-like protein [Candidatus Lucifugimonas marina]|uniref:HAD hydrolase-like protein n=1 Tax=Candidatus Lucifugimonas marina TaxID=3038979 RepID=A0AAJ5ZKG2_9CHLR|nr:HAD hydrolase-like protein [SAR202 cluster bacterium JH702]WFG35884.1 HAD hydrolase-like protein [SAR202 cluster bacterium JH545]WFG39828.1 HAD hydrolase-like protein [SAR202 cluster bacterium JH1073]